MKTYRFCLALIAILGSAALTLADGLLLATNKLAVMPIIISESASLETKDVAAELARYLRKMSGATFTVKTGDGKSGIVLGTLAEFPLPALKKPLEIRGIFDGREAYCIRTEAGRLLLIGATEKAVAYPAFRLLTLLGCRRFFPSPEWEIIPSLSTIRVNLHEDSRPALPFRRIWAGMGWRTENESIFLPWRRFNRMGQSFDLYCNHAWVSIYVENKTEFDKHPEYLALVNGKRNTDLNTLQFCVSNPGLRTLVTETILTAFSKYPHYDMMSVEANDGDSFCECAECKKLGSRSDQIFGLANEVARAVANKYPGKMVGLYAYGSHSEPPSFPLEPNVYVQLTSGFNSGRYTYDQLLHLWSKKAKNFGRYEYYSVWVWDYEHPPLGFGANIQAIKNDIQQTVRIGGTSIDCESSTNWGPYGRGYYIASHLMWDPGADISALLKDFYEKAFGPAALPMQHWYERFDPGNIPFYGEDMLARAYADLIEAGELAKRHPDVLARIDQLKLYMEFLRLFWHYDHETDIAKKKQYAYNELMHAYRIRNQHIIFAWPYLHGWAQGIAKEFNEPTWDGYANPQPPFASGKPYTHEEVEAQFHKGMAEFKMAKLLPVKPFSSDLVPVRFPSNIGEKLVYVAQFGTKYAFYILKDEPLTFEFAAGLSYTNKPDAILTVLDASGIEVSRQHVPTDQQTRKIEFILPKPGLYYLTIDTGSTYVIRDTKVRSIQQVLTREAMSTCGVMQPQYFYVPKGTVQFQCFVCNGRPFSIVGPTGQVVKEVSGQEQYLTVDIPAGMDGQPWSMTNTVLSRLWFRNIPNYLAASPGGLMVPRELVKSDGLQMATPVK